MLELRQPYKQIDHVRPMAEHRSDYQVNFLGLTRSASNYKVSSSFRYGF